MHGLRISSLLLPCLQQQTSVCSLPAANITNLLHKFLVASSALAAHYGFVVLHQHLHSAGFAGQTLAAQPDMISHQQMICSEWLMSWRQASKAKAL